MPPLPKEPFTIHGGCFCKAIRYEVSVPRFEDRVPTPYRTPGADIGDLRVPAVYICHCNDCRAATAAILPHWLVAHLPTVQYAISLKRKDGESSEQLYSAAQILDPEETAAREATCLTGYKSSPGRNRWFCNRCGTNVCYTIDEGVVPKEWAWPKMVDICLGTVNREDLEKDYMRPERMLWCDMGIPWVRQVARSGAGGVPEHPLTRIDILVDE